MKLYEQNVTSTNSCVHLNVTDKSISLYVSVDGIASPPSSFPSLRPPPIEQQIGVSVEFKLDIWLLLCVGGYFERIIARTFF